MSGADKKILFAVGSLYGGGAERVVSVWANQLACRGYNVAVLVYARTQNEYPLDDKVTIFSCAATIDEYLSLSYYKRFLHFRNIIKQYSPDCIIPFLRKTRILMFLASVGLRIKRIDTIRINPWVEEKSLGFFSRLVNRLTFRTSYKIIIQAQEQRAWLTEGNKNKAILIPNPLQDKYVTMNETSSKALVTDFIAVGRLDPQKNYPMLIEGFSKAAIRFPHIKLSIWGEGSRDYVAILQAQILACKMESNIFLMGRSTAIDVEYLKSDVFVMTSDYEGSPNTLIEAMASRLVCISTDCSTGPKELIEDKKNGFLIPVGSVDDLSVAICHVIEMSLLDREKISDLARKKILECHSVDNSVGILCDLINHL